jgi:hypothetical protein
VLKILVSKPVVVDQLNGKTKKGDIFMHDAKLGFGLCWTLLSIYSFLLIGFVLGGLSGCSGKSGQANASHESVSDRGIMAELPMIGELITTERALELCLYYGFDHLAGRIEANPDLFKKWEFDGCSMTPDEILKEIIKVPSLTEICLRHDLGYGYGEPGNEIERMEVDVKFQNELRSAGAGEFAAQAMFDAVRSGGQEKFCLPFSWGFARNAPCKLGVGLKK